MKSRFESSNVPRQPCHDGKRKCMCVEEEEEEEEAVVDEEWTRWTPLQVVWSCEWDTHSLTNSPLSLTLTLLHCPQEAYTERIALYFRSRMAQGETAFFSRPSSSAIKIVAPSVSPEPSSPKASSKKSKARYHLPMSSSQLFPSLFRFHSTPV